MMLGRGWGNRRARMARYRPVGAPSHRAAIRLARTRYGAQRGTIASAPDHAAPDGGTQGRSASSMRARVVLAGWIAHHARSRDQSGAWRPSAWQVSNRACISCGNTLCSHLAMKGECARGLKTSRRRKEKRRAERRRPPARSGDRRGPRERRVRGLGAKPPDQDCAAGYGNRNRLTRFSKLVIARDFW